MAVQQAECQLPLLHEEPLAAGGYAFELQFLESVEREIRRGRSASIECWLGRDMDRVGSAGLESGQFRQTLGFSGLTRAGRVVGRVHDLEVERGSADCSVQGCIGGVTLGLGLPLWLLFGFGLVGGVELGEACVHIINLVICKAAKVASCGFIRK